MKNNKLREFVLSNTLLQRTWVHQRARKLAKTHPEGLAPPMPMRVIVEPTNACNLSCAYCGNSEMVRPKTNMDLGMYETLLDQMVELGIPRLTLHTIGEPTLHPNIVEMLQMAADRERCVTMSTNGSLLNEKTARGIVKARPDVINFSIDGADQETIDLTRGGLNFEHFLENLRTMRRIRDDEGVMTDSPWGRVRLPTLTITCVLTPHFTREVERKFFETFGPLVDDFLFHWPNSHGDYIPGTPLHKPGILPGKWREALFRQVREPCHYPWDALFLLASGNMSVCRFDFDGRVQVGRFPESSLLELWNSESMRSLRRAHMSFDYKGWEQCRDCTATFYENRHEHMVTSRKLMRRNGIEPARTAWLASDPRKKIPSRAK
ncbi:MAG: radical SAM protein [bacterium]|nr:radical SAM/SPASM domain-containing protein [Planctomycetota bacterium]HIL52471.1 radical SAM/SPASM domain-containing protein [Planctomycetota bacterium]